MLIISDMSLSKNIAKTIESSPLGAVFSSGDFASLASRSAVDQALHRMAKAGQITRVARGLYSRSGQQVDSKALAQAVAKKTGERVAIASGERVAIASSQGDNELMLVATSGTSRTLRIAGRSLRFRRMSPKKLHLAATDQGRVLLDLWAQGPNKLTTLEIAQATGHWTQEEIDRYAAFIPVWLRTAIEHGNAPRKSVTIGLSGAYDWSNPQIKDHVLIAKVLQKHRFEDVVRLCLHYGVARVKRVFKQNEFEPAARACVSRMLFNISAGLRAPDRLASG